MDISIENQELTKFISDKLGEVVSPTLMLQKDSTAKNMDSTDFAENERKYLGLPPTSRRKRGLRLGSKYRSYTTTKEVDETAARMTKKLLTSFKYGNFQTEYIPTKEAEQCVEQAEDATDMMHQELVGEGTDWANLITDTTRSGEIHKISVWKLSYNKEVETIRQNMQGIGRKQLIKLEMNPNYEILDFGPMDSETASRYAQLPGMPPVNDLFYVEGNYVKDNSGVSVDLLDPRTFAIDKYATSMHDLGVATEVTKLTRQQMVDKFINMYDEDRKDEIIDRINGHFPGSLDAAYQQDILWDCTTRVQEGDSLHIVRAIALGANRDVIYIEDSGLLPYIKFQLRKLPSSFAAVSTVDCIGTLDDMETDLMKKIMMAAQESTTLRTAATPVNIEEMRLHHKPGATYDVVKSTKELVYHSTPFPAEVMAVLQDLRSNSKTFSGNGTEMSPLSGPMTATQAMAMDENAMALNDSRLTMYAYGIKRAFELGYQLKMMNCEEEKFYSKEAQEWKTYKFAEWPSKLTFVPSLGYGRGNRTYNLASYESLIGLGLQFRQAGVNIIPDKGMLSLANNLVEEMSLPEDKYFELIEVKDTGPSLQDRLLELQAREQEIRISQMQFDQAEREAKHKLAMIKLRYEIKKTEAEVKKLEAETFENIKEGEWDSVRAELEVDQHEHDKQMDKLKLAVNNTR